MKRNAFDVRHPVFRPLWRRMAITAVCLGWAVFEFANGAALWAVLFGACGVYLFLQFFVQFDPAEYEDTPTGKDPE